MEQEREGAAAPAQESADSAPLVVSEREKKLMAAPMSGIAPDEPTEQPASDDLPAGESSEPTDELSGGESESGPSTELIELAVQYGMSREQAADYGSSEELLRELRRKDRETANAVFQQFRQQQQQQYPQQQWQEPQGQPGAPQPAQQPQGNQPAEQQGAIKLEWPEGEEAYEDYLVKNFKAIAQHVEQVAQQQAQLAQLYQGHLMQQQAFQQQAWIAEQQKQQQETLWKFHDALDAINADRYGKSVDDKGQPQRVTDEQAQHRQQVLEHMAALLNAYPDLPPEALARRADNLVFADANQKQIVEKYRASAARQSKRRTAPPGRPQRLTPKEYSQAELHNHPEVVEAWAAMQEANASE